MKKINVITLGCSKNVVDSEHLLKQLQMYGYEVINDSDTRDADVVVINTCGFIHDAKEESINLILDFIRAKEEGEFEQVYVMGCLSERYKKDLQKEIPEVDQYFGVNDLKDIVEVLGAKYEEKYTTQRFITTPKHYSYLKIAEGCNRMCSFCAIPLIRGRYQSRPLESLIEESKYLADQGVKELLLIAQDTSYYGYDLFNKSTLSKLIEELDKVNGIEWLRLHYLYPDKFPLEVLDLVESTKLLPYFDLPVQHISNGILEKMKRGHDKEGTINLLNTIRKKVPNVALRTTLISGFPGETENDHQELLKFIKEFRFERLGVFAYSEEENTYAARKFADDVPEDVKQARVEEIMNVQQEISLENNNRKIGKVFKVLIDRQEGETFVGRTQFDSPEVDNEVIINPKGNLVHVGKFYNVQIEGATEFDLTASLC